MEKIKKLTEEGFMTKQELDTIDKAIKNKDLIIIHGQSASGKTTLAEALKETYQDNIILIDEGENYYSRIISFVLGEYTNSRAVILVLHSSNSADIDYLQRRIMGICKNIVCDNIEDIEKRDRKAYSYYKTIKENRPTWTTVSIETKLDSNSLSKDFRSRKVHKVERIDTDSLFLPF